MSAFIELTDVTKTFPAPAGGGIETLHRTSLSIGHGERLAIVGPSGSGKSTLLSILGTLDVPTSGRLGYDGRDVTGMDDRARSRLRAERIGFVFQQGHLLNSLSALDNVTVGLEYAGVPARRRRDLAAEALGRLGLGNRLGHRPSQLSGGECQRVAIARALAKRPEVVFADEPTGALDTNTGRTIVNLLFAMSGGGADRGTSLVVVTHDPAVAARFPRRLRIRDGVVEDAASEDSDDGTGGGTDCSAGCGEAGRGAR